MKLIIPCVALLLLQSLNAAPIESYQELSSALRSGNHFVIITDLEKCTGKIGMPTGYVVPKAMMLVPAKEQTAERIVTSDLHFSNHSGKPTYEYVKYTFNPDNTVVIKTTFYDAPTFLPSDASHTINCFLGNGIDIHTNDTH